MKRVSFRLLAVVLAFAVVSSTLLSGAALDSPYEKAIGYIFNGVQYSCAASAVQNDQDDDEEGVKYDVTFAFDSIADPITARLSEFCFSLDNSQQGIDHVYRQELWDVLTEYCLDLYRSAYGRDMVGRSPDGTTRELQMHYCMFRLGDFIKQMFTPVELLVGKVPQFAKILKMLNSLYRRAKVTELGPTDGSDVNGYIFEEANSDLQTMFLYGRDFLSLDFMGDLAEMTDQMPPDVLARTDQFLFHPNDVEKTAEILYVKSKDLKVISVC